MVLPHATLCSQLKCHVAVVIGLVDDVDQGWSHTGLSSGIFTMTTSAILVEELLALPLRSRQYRHTDLNQWFARSVRLAWR